MSRQGTRFSIMIAGSKGSGKSSFFNNIVGKNIITNEISDEINVYMLNLDCEGVMQKITFVDTPGFDTINEKEIQGNVISFIKEQFDLFMAEETKIRRNPKYEDTRIHLLLYFLPATSAGLKQSDLIFLEKAKELVNIVPIISKADGLTPEETVEYKQLIKEQFEMYNIPIFDLNNYDHGEEEELDLNSLVPFTVISGENKTKKINNLFIEVDNPNFNDLSVLREIILSTHIDVFVDETASVLYEKYRTKALESALEENK